MTSETQLQRRVWGDILNLEPGKMVISSCYPEDEQPAVIRYFIALHLRGLADVGFARSRRAPRVATVAGLTAAGKQLHAKMQKASQAKMLTAN